MKLLVSDYDGTLHPDEQKKRYLFENIEAIKELMANGHRFMLSTGRNFNSIKEQIDKYNIPYNYLSCNDGAVLFDQYDNVLNTSFLNNDDVNSIIKELKENNIGKDIYTYDYMGQNISCDQIIEIGVFYSLNPKEFFTTKNKLIEIMKKYTHLSLVTFPGAAFIENPGGKSRTIKFLESKEVFDHIITVGDNKNDLEMLVDYQGYKIITSYPCMYFKSIKTTTSVKKLVKKMIK